MTLNKTGRPRVVWRSAPSLLAVFSVLIAMAAVACSDEDFRLNDSVIKSNSYAERSTSTALQLSTFRLDSVQTSSQNRVWVGKTEKPVIGTIHSESYLRLAEPRLAANGNVHYKWQGDGKEVYDSCTIVLKHSGQYEGDTLQLFDIRVECLARQLEFADETESNFYNVRSFPADSVIGSFVFNPRPITRQRLRFRLNDTFGRHLRDFIWAQRNFSSGDISQNFRSFMKGIKISSSDGRHDTKSLLAFIADSTMICLHSHYRGMEAVKIERQLKMTGSNLQFNNVWNEGMDEPFKKLERRYMQVTEDAADQHSVLYEGLGYYTRINFPSIESLKNMASYQHIVKATLKVYPEVGSYDKRRIPTTFYLSEVNKGNVITSPLSTASGGRVFSTLVYDSYDRSQMYYYADITYYVNTILANDLVDENNGLVLTWGGSMTPTNYNFMIFNGYGANINRSVLEITYYNFDREER